MAQLTENSISIEVPEGATGFSIWEATMSLMGYKKGDLFFGYVLGKDISDNIKIPKGNWAILGRPASITETQWKQIVEWFSILGDTGYQDYGKEYLSYGFKTATESGFSLLKSKNVDPSKIIILIKQ
jgi:hypothetical protein